MLPMKFRIGLAAAVAAWAIFNGQDAAQADGHVPLSAAQIVERWLARPAYERRCELAKDHAAMRLGSRIVLRGLQSNAGE